MRLSYGKKNFPPPPKKKKKIVHLGEREEIYRICRIHSYIIIIIIITWCQTEVRRSDHAHVGVLPHQLLLLPPSTHQQVRNILIKHIKTVRVRACQIVNRLLKGRFLHFKCILDHLQSIKKITL